MAFIETEKRNFVAANIPPGDIAGMICVLGGVPCPTIGATNMTSSSEAAIWERLIGPNAPDLSPAAAQFILRLDFGAHDHERMAELARKSNDGILNEDERSELRNYAHVGNVLALMQSKARLALTRRAKVS